MTEPTPKNRRQFYRINDRISLEYRVMASPDRPISDYFPVSPEDLLRNELLALAHEPPPGIRGPRERDPALMQYLRGVEHRLELLTRLVCGSSLAESPLMDVSLSEGGIAFPSTQPLPAGTLLALRIQFPDNGALLRLRGKVRNPVQGEIGPGHLHVAFDDMEESDRHMLSRHIVRKQAEERRHSR